MKRARLFAGYLCVALGFAIIVMLGYGVIDPIGLDLHQAGATSTAALLLGLLPTVLLAAVVFAVGLVLVRSARRP